MLGRPSLLHIPAMVLCFSVTLPVTPWLGQGHLQLAGTMRTTNKMPIQPDW